LSWGPIAGGSSIVVGPPGAGDTGSNKICIEGMPCERLPAMSPTNDVYSCNRPKMQGGRREKCPNDSTWLPWPKTGGQAAFGVRADSSAGGPQASTYCFRRWDTNIDQYVFDCNTIIIDWPEFSWATTATRLVWGPVSVDGRIASTLAFKGTNEIPCLPMHGVFDAPCDIARIDAIYVSDAGYEDKLRFTDPACGLPFRSGDSSVDYAAGCLVVTDWYSTYPDAYLDTTIGDAGTRFEPAIGFQNAATIIEGRAYENRLAIESRRFRQWAGSSVTHSGAVTSRNSIGIGCVGQGGALCHFQVDLTGLSCGIFGQPGVPCSPPVQ
jgi:hypothetical protein